MKINWKKMFNRQDSDEEGEPLPRPERETIRVSQIFDLARQKYGIKPDASNFFENGYAYSSLAAADAALPLLLDPLFLQLEQDATQMLTARQQTLKDELDTIKADAANLQAEIDESATTGLGATLDRQLKETETKLTEMEGMLFPERVMQRLINQMMQEAGKPAEADPAADPLAHALDQKIAAGKTAARLSLLKSLAVPAADERHNLLFPPKLTYINFFFTLSGLLLFTEIGFSLMVIKNLLATPFGALFNLVLSMVYAVGIAVSFALLFKLLMERLLYCKKPNGFGFVGIAACLFIALGFFFSYLFKDDAYQIVGGFMVAFKGFILSLFSVCFSLANAFTFREASIQHHLYDQLYPYGPPEALKAQKEEWLNEAQIDLEDILEDQQWLENEQSCLSDAPQRLSAMGGNLKALAAAAFRRGSGQRRHDDVLGNRELYVILEQKILS